VLILCTDQFTNLVKATAGRLRPCYDEEIKVWVRLVKPTCGNRFGFFSGHASNSFALAVFYSLLLKPYLKKKVLLLFLIAALIAYSRVYIGVHFPLDIVIGALAGAALGYGFYLLWRRFISFQELKK
jgi:undecaprenyl-diphosphatase